MAVDRGSTAQEQEAGWSDHVCTQEVEKEQWMRLDCKPSKAPTPMTYFTDWGFTWESCDVSNSTTIWRPSVQTHEGPHTVTGAMGSWHVCITDGSPSASSPYAECHLILVFRLKDLYKPVTAEVLSWQPVSRIWLRDTFLFGLHVF